ncbi:hypothetical protein BUALT_Bualt04G0099400 [Buddleja alternifolia]|uniref:Uncharacterized protein n=1 Tax=Buddleja alternifolia TaxID=168488 RepID=A0AAV6XUF9_9LAMI|nr:hypothetical protein BUALT_Bualt04G0099400 [Buddleja alternifolia]
MAKPILQTKPSNLAKQMSLCLAGVSSILVFWVLWTFNDAWPTVSTLLATNNCPQIGQALNMSQDPIDATFYDDPNVRYTIDKRMSGWDEKRREWLKHHPTFVSENRVLLLTGSQPSACKNPLGDHWLLRFFKNKVDYCRIHGYDIFYNNALLDPKMGSYWTKIPLVKAAMVAHPEVVWIFWVDSDAIFTDMEFKIPLERYKDHNFVVHGWPNLIYEKKSWVAVNAGIFLIRNCQWSMDFLNVWAGMGPKSPDYTKWGRILRSTLKDKLFPESDDQSALVYLLLKEKKKWGDMIYVENEYYLHGYWLEIVNRFDEINEKYVEVEKGARRLRRRHAEAVSESYAAEREGYLGEGRRRRRPFITHFTGCQPCSGDHNPEYVEDACWVGMERALNFADNQVLRNYGFVHPDVENGSSYVSPLPFDFPGDESDGIRLR